MWGVPDCVQSRSHMICAFPYTKMLHVLASSWGFVLEWGRLGICVCLAHDDTEKNTGWSCHIHNGLNLSWFRTHTMAMHAARTLLHDVCNSKTTCYVYKNPSDSWLAYLKTINNMVSQKKWSISKTSFAGKSVCGKLHFRQMARQLNTMNKMTKFIDDEFEAILFLQCFCS